MHRNNRHRGGNRFSRFHSNRNFTNKYKSDIPLDQLCESDVGITEYISQLKGFSGILKARFSDFQVNEISCNGEIAKFTNTKEPEGFDSDSIKEVEIPKDTPSNLVSQDTWTEILVVVNSDDNEVVELDVTNFNKDERGEIHRTVKRIFEKKIVASTIARDDKKFITFKKYNKDDKLDQRIRWPSDKGEYVYFLVYKENVDTMEAVLRISNCLRVKASLFSYAGVKDRRGKTTQWLCIRKVEPSKLLKRSKCLRNIHIGNITFKDKPLKLGHLQGNRFRIALRNVSADDNLINEAVMNVKNKGYINYFGLQRFGNDKEVPTYEIGIKLLLGKFKEACDLILKCKKCDNPDSDISKAKKLYFETGNAVSASKLLRENENKCVESKLLLGLAKSNMNDYVNALENVPRNMRLLYIHSFQALIWNKIVSRRIKEFGLCPIVGDLVLVKNDEIESVEDEYKNENEINESDDEIEEKTIKLNDEKDNQNDEEIVKIKKNKVKILTEEDLKNYTIYDIVLPMPGYDITYPENTVKEWYKTLLEELNLLLEMPKQSVKTYTLSGTYRHIINCVSDLSWKIMHYNDPNDDLIRSDYEEFLNKPEPADQPDGQYKALIVDFCLKSSCYATMVIREILKTDTSSSAHTKLNNYHLKKEDKIPNAANDQMTIDSSVPNSLLADPAKYEDFKKSIFGITSNESLKRKLEDNDSVTNNEAPAKKTKEDCTEKEEVALKLESDAI